MLVFSAAACSSSRWALCLLFAVVPVCVLSQQPKVTTLESHPSRRANGIISLPEGSPWCRGDPTIWLPGHKDFLPDQPSCFTRGKWRRPGRAKLDIGDELNGGPLGNPVIDRHDCGVMDINNDGIMDIYCLVGANTGTGEGFNELYLTTKSGGLFKIKRHALQRFRGARTRHTAILNSVNGTKYVFISASFGRRPDGQINKHAVFRTNGKWSPNNFGKRYFDHVRGPWQIHTNSSCAISADINQDGLDDLILCSDRVEGSMFVQNKKGNLQRIRLEARSTRNWRSARVADFTGDGIPDLAVTYQDERFSFLRVFKGQRSAPYFNFDNTYFSRSLPYAAPDIEALDVNGDGMMDLYIVQTDENRKLPDGSPLRTNYCGGRLDTKRWWNNPVLQKTPPNNYTPPRDKAPDMLLLGNNRPNVGKNARFRTVLMNHKEPGCGAMVKKFGDRSLVLAQGGFEKPGHQLLLEW